MDSKEATLIVNARSRRGREWFPLVKERLEKEGFSLKEAHHFKDPQQIGPTVERNVKDKVPLIIVGGGDGTFSAVAKHFIGSESVLGVLPLGTGNSLARDLGIAAEVDAACDVLLSGKVVKIDLGVINDEIFVNVATIGLTTGIAQALTDDAKKRLGRFVYAVAICKAFMGLKPFEVTIETQERKETLRTLQVVIGSGKFHAGPFPLSPDASITDGKLRLYALDSCSRFALFKYAVNLPGGQFTKLSEIESFAAKGGKITTRPAKRVTVDGEVKLSTPFTFGIKHEAIQVMVPADFAG